MKMYVDQLIDILSALPEGCEVEVNEVRNLLVIDADGDYIGYITDEQLWPFSVEQT